MQREYLFEDVNALLMSQPIPSTVTYRCQCNLEFTEEEIAEVDGAYYCYECLIKQLAMEKLEVQRLEEKFIFFKYYEASVGSNYIAYLQQPLQTDEPTDQELDKQERYLYATLNSLRYKEKHNSQTLTELKQKILDLDRYYSKYWDSMNKFERKLFKLEEKANTARWELKAANEYYERLQKFNVLSYTFKITCEGEIGYINGLALGKKNRNRNDPEWEEVNAGLGHLFVLFCYLVLKFEYQCVRLTDRYCLGSCSKVRVGSKVYELSYSKDREKYFGELLDEWMLELELMKLHIDKTNERSYRIEFPYKIVIGEYKINGQYINPNRIKNGKWDVWTTSMKYFLTNFYYLSTVCSLADKFV